MPVTIKSLVAPQPSVIPPFGGRGSLGEDRFGGRSLFDIGGRATWIESGSGFIGAYVHGPGASTAVGAVVIAPPVGREGVITFRALRVLALELARAGFVVVRFAWRGEGDSGPVAADEDLATQWQQDLIAAVECAHDIVSVHPVQVIALRVAATIAESIEYEHVSGITGWEPVRFKAFLRQQSVLRKVSVTLPAMPKSAGVELPGSFYTTAQAASLRGLDTAERVPCLAVRTETPEVATSLYGVITRDAKIPRQSIAELVAAAVRGDPVALAAWEPQAIVETGHGTSRLRETHLLIGSDRLPAVLTESLEQDSRAGAVFASAGGEPKDGPTGLWTSAARRVAVHGIAALRADRRQMGELLDETQDTEPNPYQIESVADTEHALLALADRVDGPITGIGLCVGCWLIVRGGEKGHLNRVIAYNNLAWQPDVSFYDKIYRGPLLKKFLDAETKMDGDLGVASSKWRGRLKQFLKSRRDAALAKVPAVAWQGLARVKIGQDPYLLLSRLPRNVEVQLWFGEEDQARWERSGGDRALHRLRRSGRTVTAHEEPSLDHSLLAHTSRQLVLDQLDALFAAEARTSIADSPTR